jgi:hypothetical protein
MQRCAHAGSVLGTPRLPSMQVAGARSAVGSALPRRFATDVTANHAVAKRSQSSVEVLYPRSGAVGNRMIGQRQAEWCLKFGGAYAKRMRSQRPNRKYRSSVSVSPTFRLFLLIMVLS